MSEFTDVVDEFKPAFPVVVGPDSEAAMGISIRDYFAVHATDADVGRVVNDYYTANHSSEEYFPLTRAQARYIFADEMLKARKESGNE